MRPELAGSCIQVAALTMTLHDKFGRQITDLRISITDRCNFRCVYCRSADPENYRDHDEILSWPELDRLAKSFPEAWASAKSASPAASRSSAKASKTTSPAFMPWASKTSP